MKYKHMRKQIVLIAAMAVLVGKNVAAQIQTQPGIPQLGKNSIAEVIAAMTLEEKASLLVGNGRRERKTPEGGAMIGQTQDMVPGAAGTTYAIPRLGIPAIVVADGPAGLRISPFRHGDSSVSFFATAWPVATLLASSWDTALVEKVGEGFGNEVHEYGVDIILAPGMNIHRNPLGGRNFEYYSEDPLIAGSMAAAFVNGIQSNGVGTSIKHFAGNNQETDRTTVDMIVSERTLREIYLKGFEIAVKRSAPWTVMSSYNLINGVYASESRDLLTALLRKEWGFGGLVMTDWGGGKNPVAQMQAGNDLLMPGTDRQVKRIIEAVQHDSLDTRVLDDNIARILRLIMKCPSFKGYTASNKPDLPKHAALSRQAAGEGMVLLKNEANTLPFASVRTIAVFGNTSYDLIAGGTGSGNVNKAYTVSIAEGLDHAGYRIDEELKGKYMAHIAEGKLNRPKPKGMFEIPKPFSELLQDSGRLRLMAERSDIALITFGRNAGEGADRKMENDFKLSDTEKILLKGVAEAFHAKGKKVVVVLNIGGVIEMQSWSDWADAILLAWQPGLEGGNAVADILSGRVNPSGKLCTSFPVKYSDVPSAATFPGREFPEKAVVNANGRKEIPAESVYEEGIYVGYRFYTSHHVKPAYAFGYGLSYTHFEYSGLVLNSAVFKDRLKASVLVTNTGKAAGREVVQLYISAPGKDMDKPSEELRAFAKTELLQPGQSQTLYFSLGVPDLASFDTRSESWIAEAGNYTVKIGASSESILQTAAFSLPIQMVAGKVNKILAPMKPL
jgi:beta-glucosidase